MGKNKIRFYVVLVVLAVLFSVIAFVAPFQRGAILWLSYAFGMVAIAVQAYSWPKAFAGEGARSKVYGFPLARVTTLYLIVQLILSVIFMALGARIPAWVAVILYVVLLGIAAIGFITTEVTRDEVERQETVRKVNTGMMKSLQAKSAAIAASCSDPALKKQLEELTEAFRYSDPVSNDATEKLEMKLELLLDELKENGSEDLIQRIFVLLAERNQICKGSK